MALFNPHLDVLPAPQRALWDHLHQTPEHFTLYGGTALALHLGHRDSVDFDFFSRQPFEPEQLLNSVPYLEGAKVNDVAKNTLTCRVNSGGMVKMQFFGGLPIGNIEPRLQPAGSGFWVASLLDVAASKAKVLPERSEEKDYIDIDALMCHGVSLPTMLSAAKTVYGPRFNPVLTLKALSFFADVPRLSTAIKERLSDAVSTVDLTKLPVLKSVQNPYMTKGNTL